MYTYKYMYIYIYICVYLVMMVRLSSKGDHMTVLLDQELSPMPVPDSLGVCSLFLSLSSFLHSLHSFTHFLRLSEQSERITKRTRTK